MSCINCATATLDQRYDKVACGETSTRAYKSQRFGLWKCGFQMADILDTAEWDAALTNGDIILSPDLGMFTLDTPSSDTLEDGCGDPIPDVTTETWTFSTPASSSTKLDQAYWDKVYRFQRSWNLFWIDAEDDSIHLPREIIEGVRASLGFNGVAGTGVAVPVTSAGYGFNMNTKPYWGEGPNGKGKAGIWTVSGTFTSNDVNQSVIIPGLADSFAANG